MPQELIEDFSTKLSKKDAGLRTRKRPTSLSNEASSENTTSSSSRENSYETLRKTRGKENKLEEKYKQALNEPPKRPIYASLKNEDIKIFKALFKKYPEKTVFEPRTYTVRNSKGENKVKLNYRLLKRRGYEGYSRYDVLEDDVQKGVKSLLCTLIEKTDGLYVKHHSPKKLVKIQPTEECHIERQGQEVTFAQEAAPDLRAKLIEGDHAGYIVQNEVGKRDGNDISRVKLSLSKRWDILLALARQLYGFHLKEIIHGDIKPENFRFDQSGAQWIDFGFAKKADDDREMKGYTLGYVHPEASLENGNNTPEGDVYSFAHCIIYAFCHSNMATSLTEEKIEGVYKKWIKEHEKNPHDNKKKHSIDRHYFERYFFVGKKGSALPWDDLHPSQRKKLRKLLYSMLRFDSKERPSAEAVMHALYEAYVLHNPKRTPEEEEAFKIAYALQKTLITFEARDHCDSHEKIKLLKETFFKYLEKLRDSPNTLRILLKVLAIPALEDLPTKENLRLKDVKERLALVFDIFDLRQKALKALDTSEAKRVEYKASKQPLAFSSLVDLNTQMGWMLIGEHDGAHPHLSSSPPVYKGCQFFQPVPRNANNDSGVKSQEEQERPDRQELMNFIQQMMK